MTSDGLTPKQRRFVAEYLVDLNGSAAAVRAGYSAHTAKQMAHELLQRPVIRRAVDAANVSRAKRTEITADVVLLELLRLARVDIAGAYDEAGVLKPLHLIPEDVRRAIAGIEVNEIVEWEGEGDNRKRVVVGYTRKLRFWPKDRALELLGKHLELFVDRHKHDVEGSLADLIKAARGTPAP